MRPGRLFMFLCLLSCLTPRPGLADIDPAEYELKTSVRSESERKRLQAEFAREQQQEAERQRQDDEREARRQAAEKAAWEALPYPLRLTRTRCTACHAADNYANQRHNRIGWELVILRMQHFNEAQLRVGERGMIAAHLAEAYPATGRAALSEALQQFAVALLPFWLWLVWKILRPRHGGRT